MAGRGKLARFLISMCWCLQLRLSNTAVCSNWQSQPVCLQNNDGGCHCQWESPGCSKSTNCSGMGITNVGVTNVGGSPSTTTVTNASATATTVTTTTLVGTTIAQITTTATTHLTTKTATHIISTTIGQAHSTTTTTLTTTTTREPTTTISTSTTSFFWWRLTTSAYYVAGAAKVVIEFSFGGLQYSKLSANSRTSSDAIDAIKQAMENEAQRVVMVISQHILVQLLPVGSDRVKARTELMPSDLTQVMMLWGHMNDASARLKAAIVAKISYVGNLGSVSDGPVIITNGPHATAASGSLATTPRPSSVGSVNRAHHGVQSFALMLLFILAPQV